MYAGRRKILLVTDLWLTHPNGPATALRNLRRELEGLGHEVDLLEPGQFFSLAFPLYPEVRIPLFAYFGVYRAIVRGSYTDVHLPTEGLLGLYARRVCRRRDIPFTSAMHGRTDLYAEMWVGKWAGALWKAHLRRFHRAAALTFVLTPAMERFAHSIGIERTCIWPFAADPLFSQKGTCPTGLEKPVYLYFGRVSSEKSVEEFLRLPLPGTKLVVGDGPIRAALEKKYPDARFVGAHTGQALIDWLECADVFVMPSRTDVFPLVVVEALAAGIPVAAHDVAGPREFIQEGVNGFLDDDLATAAKCCLTLSRDACRDSVKKYSWRATAERFLAESERVSL